MSKSLVEIENFVGSGWCPDHAICVEWIDRRAAALFENCQDVDTVFMSGDIYRQFMHHIEPLFQSISPYPVGPTVEKIMTSVGMLTIKRTIRFSNNFCHVGTQKTYEELEWAKVSQEFEDIAMKDFDRV